MPAGAIKALTELHLDAKLSKHRHFAAADRKLRYHYLVGVPAIVVNVFVGTILAFFMKDPAAHSWPWVPPLSSVFSFAAATLAALQTFFNFHKSAEGHRTAGNRYLEISRRSRGLVARHADVPFPADQLWKEHEKLLAHYLKVCQEAEAFATAPADFQMALRMSTAPVVPPVPNGLHGTET